MACVKHGRQSFISESQPVIRCWASTAGKKESEGPLAAYFDIVHRDAYFGAKTWEQAENTMQQLTLRMLKQKACIGDEEIDIVFSGDLLNQCVGSSFPLSGTGIPHIGIYGACSTMAESLLLSAIAVESGIANNVVAITSSHFAASERQYRFPLGYGGQRPQTSQWTVTGSGAALVSRDAVGPRITSCTIGTVTDMGICDANNMGAAMAPAALNTILAHFNDLKISAQNYDLIVTGDLGAHGKEMLLKLAQKQGVSLGENLVDCGTMIYDLSRQDVHSGGSGCGCSAITLCGYLLRNLSERKLRNILFCGTGALLSPTSVQQGHSISGICHAVAITGV